MSRIHHACMISYVATHREWRIKAYMAIIAGFCFNISLFSFINVLSTLIVAASICTTDQISLSALHMVIRS
jgi:hypothetical protein